MVSHEGKSTEEVRQVGLGFDSMAFARFNQGIDDRAAVADTGMSYEQPIARVMQGFP